MGLADMLIKLGIKYGSEESIGICKNIAFKMIDEAVYKSSKIAKEKGAFPKYSNNAIDILNTGFFVNSTSNETVKHVELYGL